MKVPATSSRLTLVLLIAVSIACAVCGVLAYALADITGRTGGGRAMPADRSADPPPQIVYARDPIGRLALIGTNFSANEPVVVYYESDPLTAIEEPMTVTVALTNDAGTFTYLLVDLPSRVAGQGWLKALGTTSGKVATPIPYIAEPTATSLPTLTLTPTPTTADTPIPTATPTFPPTVPPSVVPSPTLDPNPFEGWYAEYFNNRDLDGEPFYKRNEYPSGEWQCELDILAPQRHPLRTVFQRQTISARWTGTFDFPSNDNYQFRVRVSDGVRVIVDGVPYINDWRFSSKPRDLMKNVWLAQGPHTIVIEYFNTQGRGLISVKWKVAYPDWEARYYNSMNWSGPVIVRRNDGEFSGPLLNTEGSPAPGVNADNFSVYWSRTIHLQNSGLYRFTGWVDDGVRIFIDDKEVHRQNTTAQPGGYQMDFSVPLRSGPHIIQIHYYEETGIARMEFRWDWVPPTPTPTPTPVL